MALLWSAVKLWRHHRRAALMVAALTVLAAAGQQPPPSSSSGVAESVLQRTRERLFADLKRLPRYTCVQTITRQYYGPHSEGGSCSTLMAGHDKRAGKLRLRGWDRLRLEVAIVGGDNVYSWVGAPRFESGTLEQLAGRGPLSTGDFGPFLHSIFSRAAVTFKGEEPAGERRLFAYAYDVPLERSSYQVRTARDWTPTAYSGTFLLDPVADDIASLTVRTAELPEENPDCQVISEIDYERAQIHDRMVLIPRQTSLVTIDRNGGESHSLTTYANCREYASKTRMLFNGSASASASSSGDTTASQSPAPAPTPLPAGLHFRARIVTAIDSDTAAAGDPIEAVLRSPMHDKNRMQLAPAGAHLHGRLVNLEQRSASLDYFHVSIQFESIDVQGQAVPLRAAPDASALMSGVSVFRSRMSPISGDTPDNIAFVFRDQHLRLEKFEWGWTTLPFRAREKQEDSSTH